MIKRAIVQVSFGVAVVVLTSAVWGHAISTFSIGNATPSTIFFIQGQSFTPSIQGNDSLGVPTATPNNTVFLRLFSFDFTFVAPFGIPPSVLYIYDFVPTEAQVSNNGEGNLGVGTHLAGGEYKFNNLEIPFNAKSYAILPESHNIFDGSGNLYTGGIDIFPRAGLVQEGFGDFDAGFNATFSIAVPEPSTLSLLTLGLLGLGTYARSNGRAGKWKSLFVR